MAAKKTTRIAKKPTKVRLKPAKSKSAATRNPGLPVKKSLPVFTEKEWAKKEAKPAKKRPLRSKRATSKGE